MEMNWSRWFRCESSFGLLLVPNQPGIYALAEEVLEPSGPASRRMLAVFLIEEAEDLVRSLNRLFTASSPWHSRLAEAKCYLRYAVTPDPAERRRAADALRHWLNQQRDNAAQIFEQQVSPPAPPAAVEEDEDDSVKTVAERAVDRVARSGAFTRAFSGDKH